MTHKLCLFLFLIVLLNSCDYTKGSGGQTDAALPEVKKADLNTIDPGQFTADEWYVPYYLEHFAAVANSIIASGPDRGYINISVWRPENGNKPYNARIMENIMSLAWFYTRNRPWNPYYGDQALKARLEAALSFWCNIQSDDGRFSEYAPEKWSLAPTAFATKFVGRALLLLHDGPSIDPGVYERARKAWRKALYVSFTNEDMWDHGKRYTNQFANLWSGALMYLKLWPDQEIKQLFLDRFQQSMQAFQSPCGFFYEAGGPDWGYDLSTHHSDLDLAWNFTRGTDLQDEIVEKMRKWYDWFSYNAVKEPGSSCFYLNRAIETRQHHGYYRKDSVQDPAEARYTPEAEFVPVARAFQLSSEERASSMQQRYDSMRKAWPQVAPLDTGEFWAFSPYAFVHDGLIRWNPTQQQKEEARAALPYLESDRFIQVRHDNRSNTSYFFIRQPRYYAIFNAGKIVTAQQRYGLGLLWTPGSGTVLQSQSKTDVAAWGTMAADSAQVYEAAGLATLISAGGKPWKPAEGINDLNAHTLVVKYPLGKKGEKTIRFDEDKITVEVSHPGSFTEILPLLAAEGDQLSMDKKGIRLHTASGTVRFSFDNAKSMEKKNFDGDLGPKICKVVTVNADNSLHYTITFNQPAGR